VRAGAAIAVGLAVAFVVWLVIQGDDSTGKTGVGPTPATTPAETVSRQSVLVGATAQNLQTLAAVSGHPIYWAGRRAGVTYELTQTPDGRIYIRYLPRGVALGDRSGSYLIVGTYPLGDAYRAIQTAAKETGAVTFKLPRGGLAVYNHDAETNVYFAYPGSAFQVEVYDPNPATARRLVATGVIRPIA
jgi:hypothetical protein